MNSNFTLYIVIFLFAVGTLFFYRFVKSQYKSRGDATKRKELSIQLHRLRDTNDLVAGAKKLPFSKALFTCLYQRQLLTLNTLYTLEPENTKLVNKIEYVKDKLRHIESSTSFAGNNRFESPENEMEAIGLLKVIKKLRVIIRAGYNKGQINEHSYVYENTRLESYQMRITIENLIKRIDYAIKHEQTVMAKELLKKGLSYLNSKSGTHPLDTIVELTEKLKVIENSLVNDESLDFIE